MRVPFTLSDEAKKQLARYVMNGLEDSEIAELMGMSLRQLADDLEQAKAANAERNRAKAMEWLAWRFTAKDDKKLSELSAKNLTIQEIAKLLKKEEKAVADKLRDWRNGLAHQSGVDVDELAWLNQLPDSSKTGIMKLGDISSWNNISNALKKKKGTTAKATRVRTMSSGRYKAARKRKEPLVLDEWWNFGVLKEIEDTRDKLIFHSADANRVQLLKRYATNWREIKLKAQGNIGKFIAVKVHQNFANTEPRVVDITTSQGIMTLAKDYPHDNREQSFQGRYKWEYFGIFEAKKHYIEDIDQDRLYLVNAQGMVVTFPISMNEDALELRVLNTIDMWENHPALICIDLKNSEDADGNTQICDIHPEEQGYEIYAADHNVIVETIAQTEDRAIEAQGELSLQSNMLRNQIELVKAEAEKQAMVLQKQINEAEEAEKAARSELESELAEYKRQERFLREAKDGLKAYQVQMLADVRDRAGKAVAVKMEGLRVVDTEFSPLLEQVEKLETSGLDPDLAKALRGLHEAAQHKKEVIDLTQQPIEQAAPSTAHNDDIGSVDAVMDAAIANQRAGIAAAMFDDNVKSDEQVPAWAAAFMQQQKEAYESIVAQNSAVLSTFSMTEHEAQGLRDFVREEQDELDKEDKEAEAKTEYILSQLENIVGQTIDCKVNNGHPKNALLLRQNIHLDQQKAKDRLHIQFLKHLYKKVFKVFLPHYNKEAMVAIVQDSDDPNQIALMNCMSLHGEAWKQAELDIAGFGGKRIAGKKATPAKLQKWHIEICERLGVEVK